MPPARGERPFDERTRHGRLEAHVLQRARYLGYGTSEIGPLAATAKEPVPISGVCAVFAESEVINHLSQGASPADIMQGAIVSLVDRSMQLMKRVQMEPEFTLVGGILRFTSMASLICDKLGANVNVPPEELVQFVGALGAAVLARQRVRTLYEHGTRPDSATTISTRS